MIGESVKIGVIYTNEKKCPLKYKKFDRFGGKKLRTNLENMKSSVKFQ